MNNRTQLLQLAGPFALGASALVMAAKFVAMGASLSLTGCVVDDAGDTSSGVDGGGSIGTPCSDSSTCAAGLFCYSSTIPPNSDLNGTCTEDCEPSASTDPCIAVSKNSFCVDGPNVCGLRCGNGLDCPSGLECGNGTDPTTQGLCVTAQQ